MKPVAKQATRKNRNDLFFSSCVHKSSPNESSRLKGVALIKNSLSKYRSPVNPTAWKKTAMAVAISCLVNLFSTYLFMNRLVNWMRPFQDTLPFLEKQF